MSVLVVNGVVVPCDTLTETVDDVWTDTRAFSGRARKHRAAIKRTWQAKTKLLAWADAWALQCMLSALGHYWPWEGDLYSTKGLPCDVYSPVSALSAAAIPSSSAADGTYNPEASYFGAALLFQTGTTNLLTLAQSSLEGIGTPPYAALTSGDTVSLDTMHYWSGTHSLKWQCTVNPASFGGFTGGTFAVSASTAYTLSFFAFGQDSANDTLNFTLSDNTGRSATASCVVYPGGWQRYSVTLTTAASASSLSFTLSAAAGGAGYVINFDGFQLEKSAFACQYTAPGVVTSTAGPLSYTLPSFDRSAAKSVTVCAWVQPPPNVATETFFSALNTTSAAGALVAVTSQTDGYLRVLTVDDYGNATTVASRSPVNWGPLNAWHHLACILRSQPRTDGSQGNCEIWLDGNNIALGSASLPTLANINQLFPGGSINNGSNATPQLWQAMMDELQYLPYAAGAAQLSNWFNDNDQIGRAPFFFCTGDFIPQPSVTCVASAIKAEAMRYPNPNTGSMDVYGTVTFTLMEA